MKKLKLIFLTIIAPALAVCCLGFITLRQNKPNGFVRRIIPDYARFDAKFKSIFSLINFAGSTDHNYFFRTTTPEMIISVSRDLNGAASHKIKIDSASKVKWNYRVIVDSPHIYLFAGNLHSLITTSFDKVNYSLKKLNSPSFFTDAIVLPQNRYLIRAYSKTQHDMLFMIVDSSGAELKTEKNLSVLKHDEGITTQGTLIASNDAPGKIFLVFKLINSILCFDTSLNPIYASHTIDTVANPHLGLVKLKQGKHTTAKISGAPRYTNYCAAVAGDKLYIYSKVKADNEHTDQPTIDVYNSTNGKYLFSFYLPGPIKQLSDLSVDGNNLTVISSDGKQLLKYHFKERI